MIKKKLKAGEYKGKISLLARDMDKMFENCKEYNRPDSKLFKVNQINDENATLNSSEDG